MTLAMKTGIARKPWSIADLLRVAQATEPIEAAIH
jgi:hypothetical protein